MKRKMAAILAGTLASSVFAADVKTNVNFDIGYLWADNYTFTNSGASNAKRASAGVGVNDETNDIDVNLAQLAFTGSSKNVDWKIAINAAGEDGTTLGYINEAWLKHNVNENLNIVAGRFYTWIGFEGIFSKDNMNYTRSLAFRHGPYWHNGVNANYDFKNGLTLSAYLTDAKMDSDDAAGKSNPGKGLSVGYTMDKLAAKANYYHSDADASTAIHSYDIYDVNVKYDFSDKFSAAIDATMNKRESTSGNDAEFASYAGYAKFKASEQFYAAFRYEMLNEKRSSASQDYIVASNTTNGYTVSSLAGTTDHKINSATFTGGYDLMNGSELKLEFRMDSADKKIYARDKTGVNGTNLGDKMHVVGAAWIYNY